MKKSKKKTKKKKTRRRKTKKYTEIFEEKIQKKKGPFLNQKSPFHHISKTREVGLRVMDINTQEKLPPTV